MGKYSVEKQIKKLNKILKSEFSYEEDLLVLGKFLFDNLPDVEGIKRNTRNSFESGEKVKIPVVSLGRELTIYADGKILSNIGEQKIKSNRDLYQLLDYINVRLELVSELSQNLKKVLKQIEKEVKG